jgi:hypothetical protein
MAPQTFHDFINFALSCFSGLYFGITQKNQPAKLASANDQLTSEAR